MSSYGGNPYSGRGNVNGAGGQRGAFGSVPTSGRASGTVRKVASFCTSCEAKLSPDEVLISSQTEGRCVTCQQLLEAQSACRVCHLPWSSSQQTNVVTCDSCGFYMHDTCAKKGALQSKSGGRVYTYCPHCPPTLLPPPPTAAVPAGGRDGGASSRGGASERSRQNAFGPVPLSLPSRGHIGPGGVRSPPGGGGRGSGGAAVNGGGGGGGMSAAAMAAAAALPPPSQAAALQQVAALLQGQLQMLQTQQQALLRQYDQQLRTVTPMPPPTAYSLFQLDMFRVYQEEGFDIDPMELQPIINNAWLQLTPDERAGYDNRAEQEMAVWTANAQLYVQLYYEYETLANHLGAVPDTSLLPKSLQSMLHSVRQMARLGGSGAAAAGAAPSGPGSGRGPGRPPGSSAAFAAAAAAAAAAATGRGGSGGSAAAPSGIAAAGGRGVKRSAMDTLAGASALIGGMGSGIQGAGTGSPEEEEDEDDEDYEVEGAQQGGSTKRVRRAISPAAAAQPPSARPPPRNTRLPADKLPTGVADLPAQLNVSCNDIAGTFITDGIKVLCHCKDCRELPRSQREFHPTHWEQHCGAGTAKKWKASVKIEPGGAPEVPLGANPMQIGKWFDMLGVEFRPAKTTGGPPVLEFTGATIRRLEAEGAAAGSAGGGGGGASGSGGSQPQLPLSQQQQQQLPASQPPSSPLLLLPPPQQQLSSPPSPSPPPLQQQQPMALLPPRPSAGRGPQPVQSLRGSVPPPGGPSAGCGRRGLGNDDAFIGGAPGVGAAAKPPRPVSDGGDGNGNRDRDGGDAGYCLNNSPRAVTTQPRKGAGHDRGEEGESSSRGSASDTLGPNTTA